jgi:hypothetical protein
MPTKRSGADMITVPEARTLNPVRMSSADGPHAAGSGTAGPTRLESYGLAPRLPLFQRSVVVQRVALLEGRLFDEDGHRRRGLSDNAAVALLDEINVLRRDLGWLGLDLRHHHIWPEDLAS